MTWTTLSGGLVALGALGLAAALYWLQRLRVRHRAVVVPTTLFWREAILDTRARERSVRFRHPWAYLFLLALGSLMWFAASGPRFDERAERDVVLVLDTSAGMARGARFESALRALRNEVDGAARATTRVVAAGPTLTTLLAPGEERALLAKRAASLAPAATPAAFERAVSELAAGATPGRELEIVLIGEAPFSADALALVPEGVTLRRVDLGPTGGANHGFVELGASAASSGAWEALDVLAAVRSEGAGPAGALPPVRATIDGVALSAAPLRESSGATGGLTLLRFADLPATGGRLRLELDAVDDLALDDAVELVLPVRAALRVAVQPELRELFGAVLAADPAVLSVDSGADVAIRQAGSGFAAELPALELVGAGADEPAFRIEDVREDEAALLAEAVALLGLHEIDADALATQAARPIRVEARRGPRRRVALWGDLVSSSFDFVEGPAFPLFMARSLRWLAGGEPSIARASAGEALSFEGGRPVALAFAATDGVARDPLGAAFVPPRAGDYRGPDGVVVAASLLDPGTTAPPAAPSGLEPTPGAGDGGAPLDAATWLGLLALLGIGLDWWLHRKERIP